MAVTVKIFLFQLQFADEDIKDDDVVYVAGFVSGNSNTSGKLSYFQPRILSKEECMSKYMNKPYYDFLSHDVIICAKNDFGDSGTCKGIHFY